MVYGCAWRALQNEAIVTGCTKVLPVIEPHKIPLPGGKYLALARLLYAHARIYVTWIATISEKFRSLSSPRAREGQKS